MEDKCILCGKPDSDRVPVTIGENQKKTMLLPVCDPCIVSPNPRLHIPRLKAVEMPPPPEPFPVEMDSVCPECFANVRCDCE